MKNTSFAYPDVFIKWFEDGTLNVCSNCIDKERGNQVAIIWEPDDPNAEPRRITYRELYREVNIFANVLGSTPYAFSILGSAKQAFKKSATNLRLVAAPVPAEILLSISRCSMGPCVVRHLILAARGDAGEDNLRILQTILPNQRIKDVGILR